ncbi:hypothetical protein [Rhizobium mayense]|uniref:Glycosyltransferase RgtA/B/C/D-like domain-containing protein n=1 Tax=Rhizobium mayense TaxID=1312184 RepID=A0ABT7K2H0_9HYPH|nr:hypothetical protein [Rhizobium mayense]MDL2402701.1 hypothetical protein [Rhizobium mayense]
MYLSWLTTLKPWMTDKGWAAYSTLFDAHSIGGMVGPSDLANSFPALKVGDTADFNHFWLYSLLAAVVGFIPHILGHDINPVLAFSILHALLLAAPMIMAQRAFGWMGVASVAFLFFSSPMIWYFNKVHSELFTFCLVLASVIAFCDRKIPLSALFLAIASTQNPPIAAPAFFMCAHFLAVKRLRFTGVEFLLLALTAIFAAIHPAYYFLRYHVFTPQLLAGGASMGTNLRYFYVWLVDLDLGILPAWPAGVIASCLGIWVAWRYPSKFPGGRLPFAVYAFLFTVICLYAQSATTNMNSGATPGPARYGLWYIPLAFPLVLAAIRWTHAAYKARPIAFGYYMLSLVSACIIFWPGSGEKYDTPTLLSYTVQRLAPRLYTPPPEIYFERYSGLGERAAYPDLAGVVGPNCHRALINPVENPAIANVSVPARCIDTTLPEKVRALAAQKPPKPGFVDLP